MNAAIICCTSAGFGRVLGSWLISCSRIESGNWEICCHAISPCTGPKHLISHSWIAFSSISDPLVWLLSVDLVLPSILGCPAHVSRKACAGMMRRMSFSLHDSLDSLRAAPSRLGRYVRSRSPRWFAGTAAVALCVVTLCLPSAYSTEWPGPTRDVLGTVEAGGNDGKSQVIGVTGVATHRDSGRLLLVTVSANGVPGYPLTNAEVLWSWIDPQRVVMPREAVVPAGQTTSEYRKESSKEMTSSQDNAVKAATRFLKTKGVDVSGMKVAMRVDDIGGPSAGMMYALGLIDKVTPEDETGGRTIAGTGTIDAKGKVGSIGGIRLKMIGAKRDGATWFLAPKANCGEVVGHVPDGLRDVSVSTLDEAYEALVAIGEGKGESLPHCAVQ